MNISLIFILTCYFKICFGQNNIENKRLTFRKCCSHSQVIVKTECANSIHSNITDFWKTLIGRNSELIENSRKTFCEKLRRPVERNTSEFYIQGDGIYVIDLAKKFAAEDFCLELFFDKVSGNYTLHVLVCLIEDSALTNWQEGFIGKLIIIVKIMFIMQL